jgi:tRNA dimethylallyltransferase
VGIGQRRSVAARSGRRVRAIRARGLRPLFVGGTPFFLKALLHGLFDSPAIDPAIRARLEAEAASPEELHARLASVDPAAAARLHANDVRRVIRALEVFEGTGKPISEWQNSWAEAALPIPVAALDWPRDALNARIAARVDTMLASGWLGEARRLRELPEPPSREASQALGYRDLFAFLNGDAEWDATVANIKLHTRQFAKRQRTWFRGLKECVPVSGEGDGAAERVFAAWGLG